MQPCLRIAAAVCVLAVSGSLCAVAAPSALAKSKPPVAEKSAVGGKKHVIVAAKKKKSVAKTRGSKVVTKQEPLPSPEPRTPTDKQDCIAVAQAFYREVGRLSKKTKQSTPPGFTRVISKLSELCGEEEFDKARISLDWMDACLQDLAGKQQAKSCSSDENLLCTVDPQSKSCLASGRLAEH